MSVSPVGARLRQPVCPGRAGRNQGFRQRRPGHDGRMSQPPAGRSRLAVALASGAVGFVVAGSLAVLLDLGGDDDADARTPVRAATDLGDLCAVVQPLLPEVLGLVADRPGSSTDRATVNPPTPLSKMPIGASATPQA